MTAPKRLQGFFGLLVNTIRAWICFRFLDVKRNVFEITENLSVSTSVPRNCLLVAVSTPWSGKSRRVRLCLEIGADPALVWKVAPSPPWPGKPRRLRLGRESRAVSALVWKVAPFPPWSRKLRHIRHGCAANRASSGFRPKLHSRAASLSLDIRSGNSGHESRQGSRRIRI